MKKLEGSITSMAGGSGSTQKKMTHWGVGPKLGICILPYCTGIILLSIYFKAPVSINVIPYRILAGVGILLIFAGIPFYISSLSTVMRAFKDRKLVTSGVYGMCRHPVYASWIVFFIPGIAFLLNNWIVLSVSVVMYIFLKILVKDEDRYLKETFGEAYLAYKKSVPPVLPIGKLKSIFF